MELEILTKEDPESLDSLFGGYRIWTLPFFISSLELLEDSVLQFLNFFFKDKIFYLYFLLCSTVYFWIR